MAKLNFPDPSESPWLAPTGVVYTFIGSGINGYWSGTELDASTSIEAVFVEVAGDDMSGDLTLGTNKIKLNAATGAGDFTGNVVSGLSPLDGVGVGAALGPGYVNATRANSNESVWRSFIQGSNAATVDITASGAATFAGQITAGDGSASSGTSGVGIGVPGYVSVSHNDRTSQNCLSIYDTTNAKEVFSVTGAGEASFSGILEVKGTGRTQLSPAGYVFIGSVAADYQTPALDVYNSLNVPVAQIFADGSASFSGPITFGNFAADNIPSIIYNNSNSQSALYIRNYGTAQGILLEANSASAAFQIRDTASASAVVLYGNGSASFAGLITAPNVTFALEADDDTKYTSTTDADGNVTLVYNGETLDVKDRLQKADTALKALKVAAAAASDFAALKSAIATALADIQITSRQIR